MRAAPASQGPPCAQDSQPWTRSHHRARSVSLRRLSAEGPCLSSSRKVRHHVLMDEVADAGEAVRRPLDSARKFEKAQGATRPVIAQHQAGDDAFRIISRMFEINQASRSIKGVVDIGAAAIRDLGGSIDPGYGGF